MSCGLGHIIESKRLGCDIWLIEDPNFKPDDGLAWYYVEELELLKKMTDDELRNVQKAKLAFPGCKVKDLIKKEG